MSTFPTHALRRSTLGTRPSRSFRWAAALGLVLAAWLAHMGAGWLWFRPAFHKQLIDRYATEFRFDPLWVMSVVKVESGFAPWAQSHRGALGLMQLLPKTAHDIAPEIGLLNFQDRDLKDPDINLHLGVYYLSKLARMFPDDEYAVLAAYNAGPGVTQQWRQGKPALELEDIPYPETRRFVRQVLRTYDFLKSIQRWKQFFGVDHGK